MSAEAMGEARVTFQVRQCRRPSVVSRYNDDRKFLEAIHYFTVHSITWRALPREYGNWNSIWKWFWRLSREL
jgi:transposase